MSPDTPFVLLDDARASGAAPARLFTRLAEEVVAYTLAEVRPAFARLKDARRRGLHAAGWIGYEAGFALEGRLAALSARGHGARPFGARPPEDELPLLHFGLFETMERIDAAAVPALLPDPAGAWLGDVVPLQEAAAYDRCFDRIKGLIAAGDIYQANLVFPTRVAVEGDPLAVYARLRHASDAGWGGIVHLGGRWLLSASPELFFALESGRLTARPMKGTAPRHPDPAIDAEAARRLAKDEKERAENLMIADLLRNDLSRIAAPGSVETPRLFEVETYPTVHQLTSTVTARLATGLDAVDALEALFPCGSITGAPKIRAMEILHEVERGARGPYTGSIGWIGADGDAGFNVAIRTLVLDQDGKGATLGVGSGVVADSTAAGERRECIDKAAFVARGAKRFDLIETMRFDPWDGILHLERHLARLSASAAALGFECNRHEIRNELQAATFSLSGGKCVRLMLSREGQMAIETRPLPPAAPEPVTVAIVPLPVSSADFRLRHKTTDRGFYDMARKSAAGHFEVLFLDGAGFLTEGSFTNIFLERGGRLLTPPLSRGVLPGVLRQSLIDEGRAVEAELTLGDVAGGGLFIGNALRGLVAARFTGEIDAAKVAR